MIPVCWGNLHLKFTGDKDDTLYFSGDANVMGWIKTKVWDETHDAAMSVRADQDSSLRWRDLVRGLNRLPVEQRTVVLLISVEDLSYAEAAAVLGIPIGTVMSRLARGRERLRVMLDEGEVRPALRRVK